MRAGARLEYRLHRSRFSRAQSTASTDSVGVKTARIFN